MPLDKQQKQRLQERLKRNTLTRALLNYEQLLRNGDDMHASQVKGFVDGGCVSHRVLIGMDGERFRTTEEVMVKTLLRELQQ